MGKRNSKEFLAGTLLGAIVGAVSALLLAPKSGKEIRHDINEQANLMKERSIQFKDSAVERGNEWITIAKEKSTRLAKTVSEQSNQVADKVKGISEQFKSKKQDDGGVSTVSNPSEWIELTVGQDERENES